MTKVIAHRGAAAEAPENTMRAFALALDLGADGLELDVRRTVDGGLVVLHDATMDRTSDGRGAVARRTVEEVRRVDAGARSAHGPRAASPERVPLLSEVLERWPGVEMTVDVKDPGAAGEVTAEIARCGREESTILYVEGGTRRRAFRLYPGRRATSSGQALRLVRTGRWPRPGDRGFPEVVHTPVRARGVEIVTAELVRRAHASARTVQAWTVDAPGEMERLAALGVDGIITNDVRAAVARLAGGR